jgi:hypothetical protein
MKVLFYEDPISEPAEFLWQSPRISCDAPWLLALQAAGCDVKMVVGSRLERLALAAGVPPDAIATVDECKLVQALACPHTNTNVLFHRWYEELDESRVRRHSVKPAKFSHDLEYAKCLRDIFAAAVQNSLPTFQADVVITWTPTPQLRRLFPDALILHKETAIFSRAPFAPSYFLDPWGYHELAAPARGHAIVSSPSAVRWLHELQRYFATLFEATDNSELCDDILNFDRTILVAGQRSGSFNFDAASNYRSQAEMFFDVLSHVPPHFGVICTEHPNGRKLRAPELAYLSDRYPNFRYVPTRPGGLQVGQQLVRHVDCVATVSSTVGFQAAFWNKKLAALGSSALNGFAQMTSAAEIGGQIDEPLDSTKVAAWLIFHYSYLDALATRPAWLAQHLQTRLELWQSGKWLSYFDEPLADPCEVAAVAQQTSQASLVSHFGFGRISDSTLSLNFVSETPFRSGWGQAEFGANGPYRWMIGLRSVLLLHFDHPGAKSITLQIGSLEQISEQHVSIGIGITKLAEAIILSGRESRLMFYLPEDLVELPITQLWLKASETSQAPPDMRELSLIITKLEVLSNPCHS